jgi:osmotically-inducible protein OsmY
MRPSSLARPLVLAVVFLLPLAPLAADAPLERRIASVLAQEFEKDAANVKITVQDGVVTLRGIVEVRATKELADGVVGNVDGVEAVRNELRLAEPAKKADTPVAKGVAEVEREFSDAWLKAKVKAQLVADIGFRSREVEVDVADGIVALTGTVPNADYRRLAVEAAKRTPGVREVRDLLKLPKAAS